MNTAICIASGPSLTKDDVEYCRGKGRVYVVNDSWRMAPWADVLYACDADWWDHYDGVPEFTGEKWTINARAATHYGLNWIGGDEQCKWSKEQGRLATGGNSGFQALNLAELQDADRIILLGYDMGATPGGRRHWFGNHPAPLNRPSNYTGWVLNFAEAASVISAEVLNCSRVSALECFKKMDLRAAI